MSVGIEAGRENFGCCCQLGDTLGKAAHVPIAYLVVLAILIMVIHRNGLRGRGVSQLIACIVLFFIACVGLLTCLVRLRLKDIKDFVHYQVLETIIFGR